MQADKFSLEVGGLRLRVASEAGSLRRRVEEEVGWEPGSRPWRDALLLGRPGTGAEVGSGLWVVYESGGIVLRRAVREEDATASACFHLASLRDAILSDLLPLRLRTLILPTGDALLVEPEAVHQLAGFDRRLAARGVTVLPSTVALVDSASAEVVLPRQLHERSIPEGSHRVARVMLPRRDDSSPAEALAILALARTVLRDPSRDLQRVLVQLDELLEHRDLVDLRPRADITAEVSNLPASSP